LALAPGWAAQRSSWQMSAAMPSLALAPS